jgi:predicted transcriptional regulator of viral defense system
MRQPARTADAEIARLAGAAHGVVTRGQLLAAGVSAEAIRTRMRRGTLIRVHPGVYRVGHEAPSVEARYLAAVWAGGEGALLYGRAAAWLLGLVAGRVVPPAEVLAPGERRIEGVRVVRCRALDVRDAFAWRGVPVTSVARTMVDLASMLSLDALARAFHEAGIRFGTTPDEVDAVLARRPNARGAAKLRAVVHGDAPVTLSTLERRFLRLLRDHGLPLPETNQVTDGRRIDCRWPQHRLTVELDGYRYHRSRHAWELDRRREREARARGDDFRRYTWGDITHPRALLAELTPVLS